MAASTLPLQCGCLAPYMAACNPPALPAPEVGLPCKERPQAWDSAEAGPWPGSGAAAGQTQDLANEGFSPDAAVEHTHASTACAQA
mmetsp:Transcript_49738/g.156555  ORF Transcript_49738/g.156555 Transcript_49738/m.156555 type:complete len:86 (+) Transcript_49738:467-724(+)